MVVNLLIVTVLAEEEMSVVLGTSLVVTVIFRFLLTTNGAIFQFLELILIHFYLIFII